MCGRMKTRLQQKTKKQVKHIIEVEELVDEERIVGNAARSCYLALNQILVCERD